MFSFCCTSIIVLYHKKEISSGQPRTKHIYIAQKVQICNTAPWWLIFFHTLYDMIWIHNKLLASIIVAAKIALLIVMQICLEHSGLDLQHPVLY